MTDTFSCTYCPAQFSDSDSFWAHIYAGTCTPTNVAEQSSSQLPSNVGQLGISPLPSQEPQHSKIVGSLPNALPYEPSAMLNGVVSQPQVCINTSEFPQYTQKASVSLAHDIQTNILEHDFTKKMNLVPTFYVPPSPVSRLPTPQDLSSNISSGQPMVLQQTHNDNLSFTPQQVSTISSKPTAQSSPGGSSNSLVSQPRLWKCTLCMVSFIDRTTIMKHFKSLEHKAKIPNDLPPAAVKTTPVTNVVSDCSNNGTPCQPLTNGFALSSTNSESSALMSTGPEDLESMIRRICREELSRVLRKELRSLLLPALQDPVTMSITTSNNSFHTTDVTASAGYLKPTGSSLTKLCAIENGNMIEMRGGAMHCFVCDIDVSSQANLEAHLLGKKHKSGLNKLRLV